MARPSEYNVKFNWLKKYNGIIVIYSLNRANGEPFYIGKSNNIYKRLYNHIYNNEDDSNLKKRNYINKHKDDITISILSENPSDWEIEEKRLIKENLKYNLFNICEGGLNNFKKTKQINLTPREHLQQANLALKQLNKMIFKRRGIENRFTLLTKEEIDRICQY